MPKSSEIKSKLFQLAKSVSPILSMSDITRYCPDVHYDSCMVTLQRMHKQGDLIQPWKGVYIISPDEYFNGNEVHVREYLDVIMRYTGRGYYVALQNSIEELVPSYDAPHLSFHVIVDGKGLPSSNGKTSPPLSLSYSRLIPYSYIFNKETKYGNINIATAELTAIDLVTYIDATGGFQAIVEALKALSSKLNFRRMKEDIFEYRTAANIQRLGYIIENILDMPAKAQPLHDLLDKRYDKFYARNLLAPALPKSGNIDKRWQLDVNIELKR